MKQSNKWNDVRWLQSEVERLSVIRPHIIKAEATWQQGFAAGIEAMRAALVEYFRVWPRDDMTADFISKFDVPSHFLRPPAESDEPGTPLARLTGIAEFVVARGLCTGLEAKPPELFLMEAYDALSASEPAGAQTWRTLVRLTIKGVFSEWMQDAGDPSGWEWDTLAREIAEAIPSPEPAGAPSEEDVARAIERTARAGVFSGEEIQAMLATGLDVATYIERACSIKISGAILTGIESILRDRMLPMLSERPRAVLALLRQGKE
jgi:hypothetical protein